MRFLECLQSTGTILHWKHLSLIGDEEVITLSHAKFYVFSDSVLCRGRVNENPASNTVWENKLTWLKSSSQYRAWDTIDGEPMEFEWDIFPRFTTLQLCNKVQEFMTKMGDPSQFKGRIIFMSMFNDISSRSPDNEQECELGANLVSVYARRFSPWRWLFLRLGPEKKWYSTHDSKPQGEMGQSRWIDDDIICRKLTPSFPCHKSIIQRNAQEQRWWKIVSTLLRWWGNDWNCFSQN